MTARKPGELRGRPLDLDLLWVNSVNVQVTAIYKRVERNGRREWVVADLDEAALGVFTGSSFRCVLELKTRRRRRWWRQVGRIPVCLVRLQPNRAPVPVPHNALFRPVTKHEKPAKSGQQKTQAGNSSQLALF